MAFRVVAPAFLLTLGVVASSVGVGRADTVSYSSAIPSQDAPFSSTFTLPKFDIAFGTLTAIRLSLNATTQASITVFNLNSGDEPFTNADAAIPLTVNGPAATTIIATPTATVASGIAVPGLNRYPGLSATASSSISVPYAGFAAYKGTGADEATFTASAASGSYSGTGNVGLLFGGSAIIGGKATITYTYIAEAAPEPCALTLLCGGIASGAVLARRRRA